MMRMRSTLLVLALLCAGFPRAGHAQLRSQLYPELSAAAGESRAAPPVVLLLVPPPAADTGAVLHSISIPGMALGGYMGSTLGIGTGLIVALVTDLQPHEPECVDVCIGDLGFAAVVAGGSVGTALGVHLANHRRGSFPRTLLASTGILVAGVGAAALTDASEILIGVQVVQIAGAVWAELQRTPRP